MPAISNLNKAFAKINEESSKVADGEYTIEVATGIFNAAVTEFNLDEEKANQLKVMKFERPLDEPAKEEPELEVEPELTPEQVIESLQERIDVLTAVVAKIATLTGNGNHLKEYGIEKWQPSKSDMGKKYNR